MRTSEHPLNLGLCRYKATNNERPHLLVFHFLHGEETHSLRSTSVWVCVPDFLFFALSVLIGIKSRYAIDPLPAGIVAFVIYSGPVWVIISGDGRTKMFVFWPFVRREKSMGSRRCSRLIIRRFLFFLLMIR
jgi:hypothetical protein